MVGPLLVLAGASTTIPDVETNRDENVARQTALREARGDIFAQSERTTAERMSERFGGDSNGEADF